MPKEEFKEAGTIVADLQAISLNKRIVITGGPGAGKTALLSALASRGYACVPETARAIIQDRKEPGLSPRPLPADFAQEVLRADIERYRSPSTSAGYVFFDRGILDALCMVDQLGLLPAQDASRCVADYPYFPKVFVLPPWQQIYETDAERDQTFIESIRVHDALCGWYVQWRYELVKLPRTTVDKRCEFVLQMLE